MASISRMLTMWKRLTSRVDVRSSVSSEETGSSDSGQETSNDDLPVNFAELGASAGDPFPSN